MNTTTVTSREESFEGVGGLDIFVRVWRPAQPPRGVLVIVHGFNSHSAHYAEVAEHFAVGGLAVYALDLRGRGKSDGERFYVQEFADYVSDVASLVNLARSREPALPAFMLGHSAGGVVACLYAAWHPAQLAGLICESFAFQLPAADFTLALIKGLSRIAPHVRLLRLKNEDFSRNPEIVSEMNADPLILNEVQPTNTLAELVRAGECLKKEFSLIRLPLLILHGTEDRATKPSGSRLFHDLAGSTDKTLKLYEGHFHDLLRDLGKELVMADIGDWIDVRILPGGPAPRVSVPG